MLVQIENAASARAQTPSDWNPDFRLFDTEFGHHLLMVNGSRVIRDPRPRKPITGKGSIQLAPEAAIIPMPLADLPGKGRYRGLLKTIARWGKNDSRKGTCPD